MEGDKWRERGREGKRKGRKAGRSECWGTKQLVAIEKERRQQTKDC